MTKKEKRRFKELKKKARQGVSMDEMEELLRLFEVMTAEKYVKFRQSESKNKNILGYFLILNLILNGFSVAVSLIQIL